MAPLQYNSFTNLLLLYSALFLFTSLPIVLAQPLSHDDSSLATRRLLPELQKESQSSIKKKSSTNATLSSPKNQTKLIKSTSTSPKNQTKLIKTTASSPQNQAKLIKLASETAKNKTKLASETAKNKTKLVQSAKDSDQEKANLNKAQFKKLNSTAKSSNSTKVSSNLAKKKSDLIKQSSPKNKTTKPITSKPSQTQLDKKLSEQLKSKNPEKPKPNPTKTQKPSQPTWADQDDEDDLVAEFRDLPSKFQETLLPDLERISTTSKVYLTRASKQMTKGFKPIVGTKYAATVASIVSFAFIVIPLILVSLIFHQIKAYFSLQKLVIFVQVYLAIYFSILCLSSVVTGLEPLKFFYATSRSTYVCVQVLQTLAYVLYLLLLLMYLVLVFSTETGPASKMLGLGQTLVGFAVGLHYYVTVFHRVVLHQPPKTSWKVHAMYATCFLVICLLARADRRKKAYLEDGGEEGKKS